MPLNDHNNIELVPTPTKVPVPFVVVFGSGAPPSQSVISSGPFRSQMLRIEIGREAPSENLDL